MDTLESDKRFRYKTQFNFFIAVNIFVIDRIDTNIDITVGLYSSMTALIQTMSLATTGAISVAASVGGAGGDD